jgi:hypothetical protein
MGGVTPTGQIYVLARRTSLNGLHTIEFLRYLIHHVGSRLVVIWDGSPIHRRAEIRDFLAGAEGRDVHVELRNMVFGLGSPSPGIPSRDRPTQTETPLDSVILRGAGLSIEALPAFCNAQ